MQQRKFKFTVHFYHSSILHRGGKFYRALELEIHVAFAVRLCVYQLLVLFHSTVSWRKSKAKCNSIILSVLCTLCMQPLILSSSYTCEVIQFSSVAQLCLTLCDTMDCSTPVFPVHHQLLKLAQTHVH